MLPLLLLLLLLLLYRNTETREQKRKNEDRMTGERGRGGRRREITRDLGQHTARPACQSSLSYSRMYSHILSFLSYSNARFLFPCRIAVFLLPSYAVLPRSNRRTELYSSFRDRDASVVVLEQGAARRNAIEPRQAGSRILAGRLCPGNASCITNGIIVFEFGGRGRIREDGSLGPCTRKLSSMSRTKN